ncbi:uncharacterized protein LOC144450266 [Glandiceps talaboti]
METTGDQCRRWPSVVTFSLSVLGYFRVCKGNMDARCLPCWFREDNRSSMNDLFCFDSENEDEKSPSVVKNEGLCLVCKDLNTNFAARRKRKDQQLVAMTAEHLEDVPLLHTNYPEQKNQVDYMTIDGGNHDVKNGCTSPRVINVLTMLWLLVPVSLLIYDWLNRLYWSWGIRCLLLYTLSYSTYLLPLLVVACMRIISKFYESKPSTEHSWPYTLTTDHILPRLKVMDLKKFKGFGYLCISFAVVCIGFELAYNIYDLTGQRDTCENENPDDVINTTDVTKTTMTPTTGIKTSSRSPARVLIGLLGCFVGELMFASFCYIVYLLKQSLRAEMTSCLYFLKHNIENVDICRQRIMATYLDFLRLQRLISVWLVFQFSLSIFKVSCQIYWNYWVYNAHRCLLAALLINIMIWMEITMFLFLPPLAVGGFSIAYLWDDYKLNIRRLCRENQAEKWRVIVKHVKALKTRHTSLVLTVFFSVLGIFSALHLSDQIQYGEYWDTDSFCANITRAGTGAG